LLRGAVHWIVAGVAEKGEGKHSWQPVYMALVAELRQANGNPVSLTTTHAASGVRGNRER
jgi:hypothetical protein